MSRTGDLEAFSVFVRERGTSLRRTAFLLTRDWYLADDLVQSALIRTFERRHRIRDPLALDAYTRKVMTSVFLSGRRVKAAGEVIVAATPDRGSADATDAIAQHLEIWAALGQLTDMQRAVLVLRYYGDSSEADIAAAVGCSRGSVKTHASRGLAALRRTLGGDVSLTPVATQVSINAIRRIEET